jgi:hypothetical protein
MKYTILEIMPAQIRVEYEDSSWAIVPIQPNDTVEDIDNAVANYDKDFLPKPETLINTNISVGDERTSTKKEVVENINVEPTPAPSNPVDVKSIAEYYASRGDTRLADILTSKVEDYVSQSTFSLDELISELSYNPDEIFEQAEAELNAGQ